MPDPGVSAGAGRQRLAADVRGRVQGVGFRRYVQRWARTLALDGWVRNEPDGTVRVVAEGEPEALNRLARLLWGGPPGADVQAVDAERGEAIENADGFEIRR